MIMTIDGKTLPAKENETILQVAKRAGIEIPTLCHKAWAEPSGSCRICSVEVTQKSWEGWSKLVTSCNHPAQDGLIVYTKSERVIRTRKVILDLLLARCPDTPEIQNIAEKYGVFQTSYVPRKKPDNCILCGLCIKACETIGANAISTVNRGIHKEINTPFHQPNNDCIGCAACVQVCPTNHIKYKEENDIRYIWRRPFKMLTCSVCGRAHITEAQAEHFSKRSGLPLNYFEKCEVCHQKETAQNFCKIQA